MKPLTAAAALVVLAQVAACGESGGESTDRPAPTVTVTVTEQPGYLPATGADSTEEPNLGAGALEVGDSRTDGAVTTTIAEIDYPMAPPDGDRTQDGMIWFGLRVEQCLAEGSGVNEHRTIAGTEMVAVTPGGEEIVGIESSWIDWPKPKFPSSVGMIPGRCSAGWLALQVPEGTEVERVLWRPYGDAVAEWNVA